MFSQFKKILSNLEVKSLLKNIIEHKCFKNNIKIFKINKKINFKELSIKLVKKSKIQSIKKYFLYISSPTYSLCPTLKKKKSLYFSFKIYI